MEKRDIIEEITEYPMSLDDTYRKDAETFLLICNSVTVNGFCFRNIRKIHFCGNTLWIGENTSIDCENIETFRISYMSCRYELEDIGITSKTKDGFEVE